MKFNSLTLKLCTLFILFSLISCEEKTKQETPKTTPETTSETTETPKENNTYYAWVDNINVRNASNTKGKVIGTYSSSDPLEFTGTKSDAKDIIVLRGVAYDENWLKITTTDNKEGWVFGGAVKKEGDKKGNGIITKDVFDFPYFGNFDVTKWTDLGVVKSEAGDAETSTFRYMKNNQILEIEKTDVGEYGYYYTYKLMDTKNKLQKERKFSFQANMGDNGDLMELTEIVKDFSTKKEYSRKQMLTKHFMQLNSRPEMVNGVWKESGLEIETKSASE
ncbi:SH3 domain-containing protein [Kordia sp. YSTF-M3]|uniref:SH3 domain-containing protein n=1 Tax=Kordia aestuariivivens TaxID=2759037 RepID=A0ABR7Q4B2_9FLAO|nr:SH3 domain-containing protein [Kordia aestuariivivens]MBC8753404.1 SH3 domain-containing protein [Kordia aestuariivivens]